MERCVEHRDLRNIFAEQYRGPRECPSRYSDCARELNRCSSSIPLMTLSSINVDSLNNRPAVHHAMANRMHISVLLIWTAPDRSDAM